jgi:hypothetical protein
MAFHDTQVFSLIDQIRDHYRTNIFNQHLRPAYTRLQFDSQSWESLDRLMSQSPADRAQGYGFQDLYERVYCLAQFVFKVRTEIVPHIRSILGAGNLMGRGGGDTLLRDMAISNFPSNLDILADLTYELYMRIVLLDKESHSAKAPVYTRLPELAEMGRLLVKA